MKTFQLISCIVHLAGNRDSAVYRGEDEPVTYPETLILQAMHGGSEHVHTMVSIGEVDRDMAEEHQRLQARYGAIVDEIFPRVGGVISLPTADPSLPTSEEIRAGAEAASAARAAVREAAVAAAKAPDAPADKGGDKVPSLDKLPS